MAANIFKKIMGKLPHAVMKSLFNLWKPFRGAGIHIEYISKDFKEMNVSLKLHWYNKNLMGSHFGGSIYAMTDPFYMTMLINILGKNYIVWDKAAYIRFKKPGLGKLTAKFRLTDEDIQHIKQQADTLGKYDWEKQVLVMDEQGDVVAEVNKIIYVKSKSEAI